MVPLAKNLESGDRVSPRTELGFRRAVKRLGIIVSAIGIFWLWTILGIFIIQLSGMRLHLTSVAIVV
jgi:hypothetical protein